MQPHPETCFGNLSQFQEAFADLYPRLVGYARRYGSIHPDDVAQEAFVILMKRDAPIEYPAAFLYGTVRTLALTERRPMKNQGVSLEAILEPGVTSNAHDACLNREIREKMRTLPPNLREALWLFVVEELSIKEISKVLAIPEATVKTRIHRAKAQLREQLNATGDAHAIV